MPLLCDLQCRRLKGADQAAPIKIRQNISDDLAPKLTALHLLLAVKCSHFVNLLMFLFVLAGLMHKMSKLLDISRETLAKYIWKKKNMKLVFYCLSLISWTFDSDASSISGLEACLVCHGSHSYWIAKCRKLHKARSFSFYGKCMV